MRQEEVRNMDHWLALRAATVRSEEARSFRDPAEVKGTDRKTTVQEREEPEFE